MIRCARSSVLSPFERCGDPHWLLALVPVEAAGSAAVLAPDDCGVLRGPAVLLRLRLLLLLAALYRDLSHNIISSGLYFTWNAASCSGCSRLLWLLLAVLGCWAALGCCGCSRTAVL